MRAVRAVRADRSESPPLHREVFRLPRFYVAAALVYDISHLSFCFQNIALHEFEPKKIGAGGSTAS